MAPKASKADKKIGYDQKLCQLLDEFNQILVAAADNVGSKQLQQIRQGLRGDSVVPMGKNTMMKRSIRIHAENTGNMTFLNLIPLLGGNVGLIFTKGDLKEVREEVAKYKVHWPKWNKNKALWNLEQQKVPILNSGSSRAWTLLAILTFQTRELDFPHNMKDLEL
ncbi:large ribosomal subunit protein uL10-like [Cornus florida]|uniref:large ribosomal subunit protein uL10-like n=1 Tax=Cornus florida TaxID=4283 RepID=UPI00289A9D8E|nr:large ribosomal subunit protein uL10-like [Cornus florida]